MWTDPFWSKSAGGSRRVGLARWIHDNLDYSTLWFFPTYWAVNIGWHERPERRIDSYAEPKGRWVPN